MYTGISLYFSNSMEKNEALIKKAAENGVKYVFTSLHIPEETGVDYRKDMKKLLAECKEKALALIVDAGPETFYKLGVKTMEELIPLGVTHVRLDYGFTAKETVEISKNFQVVFNASTISEKEILEWKSCGADFTRFTACHNFYPKKFSGLSIKRVREINQRLKYLGFTVMAFVPGNQKLRGPLFEGLPTVEEHRNRKEEVILNMLDLYTDGGCDVVLVGDVDIKEKDWKGIKALNEGYVELEADIFPAYEFVRDIIHHDRPDSSEYVFRSQESRQFTRQIPGKGPSESDIRRAGSITISNENYLRYMGEMEIARVDLPLDERENLIGQIHKKDIKYLPYIQKGFGVKLV